MINTDQIKTKFKKGFNYEITFQKTVHQESTGEMEEYLEIIDAKETSKEGVEQTQGRCILKKEE